MNYLIEAKSPTGEQVQVTLVKDVPTDKLSRVEGEGREYDIAVVNPAVLDLLEILQTSDGVPVFAGNPLMTGEAKFLVEYNDRQVPIGPVQFVQEPAIGAAIIKFKREDRPNELAGYVLHDFELLGRINYIDTRGE